MLEEEIGQRKLDNIFEIKYEQNEDTYPKTYREQIKECLEVNLQVWASKQEKKE